MKELAKQYDPSQVEDRIYQFWLDGGYFHTKADPDKKPYTIVMPPPNVTGQLHMGHAVDNTMQDILIRTKRMQGYAALWVPGTDHASIATEAKVVEAMRAEEVSLVAILDADKEGFLRSHRSLTQTAGRAARNVNGKVIMYADRMTDSMKLTIDETNRRREKQLAYNEANGITPQQIKKARNLSVFGNAKEADELLKERHAYVEPSTPNIAADPVVQYMSKAQMEKSIERTRKLMQEAAKKLEFIEAAQYRDELLKLEDLMKEKWG